LKKGIGSVVTKRGDLTIKILNLLAVNSLMTANEVRIALNIPYNWASGMLTKLAKDGKVRIDQSRRPNRYTLALNSPALLSMVDNTVSTSTPLNQDEKVKVTFDDFTDYVEGLKQRVKELEKEISLYRQKMEQLRMQLEKQSRGKDLSKIMVTNSTD